MALSKDKKNQVVSEVIDLMANSKMTVITAYKGTPVKALQNLRREGKDNGTTLKVIKNRLVKQAIISSDKYKDVDLSELNGMLLYAFNAEDEVAPAQVLAKFAKTQPTLQFVGAITSEGKFLSASEVTALSVLPNKTQLIAGIINTLNSPTRGVIGALQGNLHGLLDAIALKAK